MLTAKPEEDETISSRHEAKHETLFHNVWNNLTIFCLFLLSFFNISEKGDKHQKNENHSGFELFAHIIGSELSC